MRRFDSQLAYNQCVEDNLNKLLHMAWMTVQNRDSLSNRTRTILASLPYIHSILKHEPQDGQNYDLLITDSITNSSNQLHALFAVMSSSYLTTETSLPKILQPKKKKKKKEPKTIVGDISTLVSSVLEEEGEGETGGHGELGGKEEAKEVEIVSPEDDDVVPEDKGREDSSGKEEAKEVEIVSPEDDDVVPEDKGTDDSSGKEEAKEVEIVSPIVSGKGVPKPILYQVDDWQNGTKVTLNYNLSQFATSEQHARTIFKSLDDFHKAKFLAYSQVNTLYASLEGSVVNRKGSHDTWEFNKDGRKIKTVFFKLHDKDQYGDWTKLKVASVVREVLLPFCHVGKRE